ncbi:MAG: hypothetical protein CSYNP_02694 [Syntrophus sp. SKADARSKE-3]|nr:hypothetical protein [Syntrophus sp. SKADARSKE-3]
MSRKISLLIILLFAAHLSSGCAVAPLIPFIPFAGAAYEGYVVWKGREATRYYGNDLDTIYLAVKKTTEQLKLETRIQDLSSNKGYHVETGGNMPMVIDILPVEQNVTKVVLTIARFGDKQYAEFFYKTIEDNIPKKAG